MKRIILTGILALATGVFGLMAQQKGGQTAQQKGGQKGQPAAAPSGPQVSPEERQLLQAMIQGQGNPDVTIKNAEELLQKFPSSVYKETVLVLEADAYETMRNPMKAQITFESALQVNPKNIQANMGAGEVIIQQTGEKDLDREEKLTKAEAYLTAALESLKGPKPNPGMSDSDWADASKIVQAQVRNNFGLAALLRKKLDVAVTEFKAATDLDPAQITYTARYASALQGSGKNAEAIAVCDKLLADPQLNPAIKNFTQTVKNVATKASQAPAPAPTK